MAQKTVEFKLPKVRLSFPQLFEAVTVNGEGKPSYSGSFLADRKTQKDLIDKLNATIEEVAKDKWKDKAPGILKSIRAADKVCLHDGDNKSEYDGYPGSMFINARSYSQPRVCDRDPTITLVQADGRIYSGCYVNAVIGIWAMDNKYGKRICAELKGVQFYKDGEPFSGGRPADAAAFSDFESFADDEDDLA